MKHLAFSQQITYHYRHECEYTKACSVDSRDIVNHDTAAVLTILPKHIQHILSTWTLPSPNLWWSGKSFALLRVSADSLWSFFLSLSLSWQQSVILFFLDYDTTIANIFADISIIHHCHNHNNQESRKMKVLNTAFYKI